jgi:hypothetical protein
MPKSADLFQDFAPAEEVPPIFCHQDFLQKVEDSRKSQVGKRASLLLQRLAVDSRREFYKSTLGINKGWRRSRLGGHSGSHFYAWWAPKGAPPLRGHADFESAPEGALFLRDIRHHDDHSELNPQSLSECYLPLGPRDLRSEEYVPSPLTSTQSQFTSSRQRVRIIKGYPGSGKTTALWHAADHDTQQSSLYVTYSKDLAGLARTHFQRFAPNYKSFHVYTFARLVRELAGSSAPQEPESVGRERFLKELATLPPRLLGPWVEDRKSLYDEIHANLIGTALPVAAGRFAACEKPFLPDRVYREQRRKFIGGAAADVVLEVIHTLTRREPRFHELFFPELLLAWRALERLRLPNQTGIPSSLLTFDCIAVDEAQDLTPLEAMVIAQLALPNRDRLRGLVTLLLAGDEAQTVRATDFEWGWLHDMLHQVVGTPQEFRLGANLRSPRRIARLINAVWGLYATIPKQDRPGGSREAEIEDEANDQLLYCAAAPGPELEQLLRTFADREGLAIISLSEQLPGYLPEDLKPRVVTVAEAKGLDFQAVCLLDASARLTKILATNDRVRRDMEVEPLSRRLAIDQLRVALSRPTERIYFLDVSPGEIARDRFLHFLTWAGDSNEVAPAIPSTVLKTLEEELLDPEERVRLCELDARQYLDVKPEMAWVRAKQAVTLLGPLGDKQSVADMTVRNSAHLTFAEVSFTLAMRGVRLPRELGSPQLFEDAWNYAARGRQRALRDAIEMVQSVREAYNTADMVRLLRIWSEHAEEFEPWFAMLLAAHAPELLQKLESGMSDPLDAVEILSVLPVAYALYGVPDANQKIERHRRQALDLLLSLNLFKMAMPLIEQDAAAPPELKAACLEGLNQHVEAATIYRAAGDLKSALRNYRAIPDIAKSLELMRETGGEPAASASLEWITEVERVFEKRPSNLARTATPAEKKFLAALLEAQLDGPRAKKPAKPRAPRKTVAKRAPKAK